MANGPDVADSICTEERHSSAARKGKVEMRLAGLYPLVSMVCSAAWTYSLVVDSESRCGGRHVDVFLLVVKGLLGSLHTKRDWDLCWIVSRPLHR